MLAWSRDWDLVVGPPNAHAALLHGESDARLSAFTYTMTWNLAGWPAAVVRAGTSPEGLPIGVQLAAPPWRDDVALAAAACVEAALGGFRPPAELAP
jgi:amidase